MRVIIKLEYPSRVGESLTDTIINIIKDFDKTDLENYITGFDIE